MAPVLFNLYLTLVLERWGMAMEYVDPATGMELMLNINGDLFPSSRCRRTPSRAFLSDFEYADDAILIATARPSAVLSLTTFCNVAHDFSLTVNTVKTKFLVAGHGMLEGDCESIDINGSPVEHVEIFPYLGSVITPDARSRSDV